MILRMGHRGAKGYEPENTLRSFKKALELKVDIFELDVYVCKSGEVVVIHDENVDRTTNGKGRVAYKTLRELKNLTCAKGEKIPTLEEVFDLTNRKAKINIELKGPNTAKPVADLIKKFVKEKSWSYDDFLISSFNWLQLKGFKKSSPATNIGILTRHASASSLEFADKIGAYSVNISFRAVNKEFINKCHNRNLKVFIWTVNNPDDIKRMKELGVDGIFSDFPDRV